MTATQLYRRFKSLKADIKRIDGLLKSANTTSILKESLRLEKGLLVPLTEDARKAALAAGKNSD
jgi:hypothetical protein